MCHYHLRHCGRSYGLFTWTRWLKKLSSDFYEIFRVDSHWEKKEVRCKLLGAIHLIIRILVMDESRSSNLRAGVVLPVSQLCVLPWNFCRWIIGFYRVARIMSQQTSCNTSLFWRRDIIKRQAPVVRSSSVFCTAWLPIYTKLHHHHHHQQPQQQRQQQSRLTAAWS